MGFIVWGFGFGGWDWESGVWGLRCGVCGARFDWGWGSAEKATGDGRPQTSGRNVTVSKTNNPIPVQECAGSRVRVRVQCSEFRMEFRV